MADTDYKAFIVEGEAREPLIIDNIGKIFFKHNNLKIITLPAGQNIYMLWKKLKDDDFDTDIIEVLKEEHKELQNQLAGLCRGNFSEVYLFFDYDGHQNNLNENDNKDVLDQMLTSFDNETKNGKLYISYPMVESLRDFESNKCGNKLNCFTTLPELASYKMESAARAMHPQFDKYNFEIWEKIIDVFAMRLSCLMNQNDTLLYEQYIEKINPYEIQILEQKELKKGRIFILNAFPEFLLDYFGIKLWKKCVKHASNQYDNCQKENF